MNQWLGRQVGFILFLGVVGVFPAAAMEHLNDKELGAVRGGHPLYQKEDCQWVQCADYDKLTCGTDDDPKHLGKCVSREVNNIASCVEIPGVVWLTTCTLDNVVPCAVEKVFNDPQGEGACADNQCAGRAESTTPLGANNPSGCHQITPPSPPPTA